MYKIEWKTIPLYPDYIASTQGEIARKKDGLVLKQYLQKSGYVFVIISRGYGSTYIPVHRLIAMTFLDLDGYKKGLYVDHINTIRSDNRVKNLRWVTPKENSNNETTKKNRKMSRSYKKFAGGTNIICKSQKKGKRMCHRKFRRNGTYHKMREAMNSWDLGGDGKAVYTFDKNSEEYEKYTRK